MAFDYINSKEEKLKKKDATALVTPSQPNVEAGAVTSNLSADKVTNNNENDIVFWEETPEAEKQLRGKINDISEGMPNEEVKQTEGVVEDKTTEEVLEGKETSEAKRLATDAVSKMLSDKGVNVHIATDAEVEEAMREHDVQMMGSRVDKRMEDIGKHFEGKEMSPEQQAVVDVFSGKKNNVTLKLKRTDGERTVVMRQGNEANAGTKHSIFGHYGTGSGVITADEIAMIPDVIRNGEVALKKDGKGREYSLVKKGHM